MKGKGKQYLFSNSLKYCNVQDDQKLLDYYTGRVKIQGPQLVYLRDKLLNYDGTFILRRLIGPLNTEGRSKMLQSLFYDFGFLNCFKII